MINIYIPKNLKIIVLENNYLYLYNKNYFFSLKLKNHFFFNKYLNILKIKLYYKKKLIKKNFLNNFFFLWNNFLHSKFYFLGKGFKIKKIKNNLIFNFNHSHLNLIINQQTIIKKIQKNKILIFSKKLKSLKNLEKKILNIKKISFYTKRGLRRNKQIIFIKKNKNNT